MLDVLFWFLLVYNILEEKIRPGYSNKLMDEI